MNRKFFIYAILAAHLVLMFFLLQMPVDAAPPAQLIRDLRPTEPVAEPLLQPLSVQVSQTVPITLTLGSTITTTTELSQSVPLTLMLDLDFVLSQTLTSTVAASITLSLADGVTFTVPVSLSLGTIPSTTLVVTPLSLPISNTITATLTVTPTEVTTPSEIITETLPSTPTATLAPTDELTVSVTATPTIAVVPPIGTIASTANVTANLRAGPGVAFALVGQLGLGQPAVVTGVSGDGAWYLLDTGAWIAVALLDNPPANPPAATDPLIAAVQATATARPPAIPAPTEVITTDTPAAPILLPTATPTPPAAEPVATATPVAAAGLPPTVTVDANLRSGPGLEFPIIGGTVTGQTLNIVARNEAGDWFLLDNGGWVASFLIANPPTIAAVPLFDPNQPPAVTEPITPTAPITTTAGVTTTTPATTTTPPSTGTTPTLGVADRLYLVDVDELLVRYDSSLDEIDALLTQASQNQALLQDAQWLQSMTTSIALLRATNTRVQSLTPTSLLQPVQDALAQATSDYDAAATLLAEGIESQDTAQFDEAFIELARGNARLDSAADLIAALTQ